MEDKQTQLLQELKNKLDLITKLLTVNLVKDEVNQKDQIVLLNSFNFTNTQISELLGIKSNAVRATISREKQRKTKKHRK